MDGCVKGGEGLRYRKRERKCKDRSTNLRVCSHGGLDEQWMSNGWAMDGQKQILVGVRTYLLNGNMEERTIEDTDLGSTDGLVIL